MRILSIETSCDETAVSVVEATGDFPMATYSILGNALFSQVDIHREYGGVFPALAKREHAKTLVPMLTRALTEATMLAPHDPAHPPHDDTSIKDLLVREPGLSDALGTFLRQYATPDIDLIAVTTGPGLEPALWVGINFARALSHEWHVPVVPINHMEGHVLSSIFDGTRLPPLAFPAIALLISGGHTELVLMRDWAHYERIGETRDDAVGEAFDKVARMLGLPYPGGPEISLLASRARNDADKTRTDAEIASNSVLRALPFPRPMLNSGDLDFSFSGLKTAVRYAIEKRGGTGALTEDERLAIAHDFEDAVTTVLLKKTLDAAQRHDARTIIVGGGVSANTFIRETFIRECARALPEVSVYFPPRHLSTDNSVMIALAGHARAPLAHTETASLCADGTLALG